MIEPQTFDTIIASYHEGIRKAIEFGSVTIDDQEINLAKVELEIRFRAIKQHEFMRVINRYFSDVLPITIVDEFYQYKTGKQGNNFRRSLEGEGDEQEESWLIKHHYKKLDYSQYNIRLSIAIEEHQLPERFNTKDRQLFYLDHLLVKKWQRVKQRWIRDDDDFSLQATKVTSDGVTTYELEIELQDVSFLEKDLLNSLNLKLEELFCCLNASLKLYTIQERSELIKYVNTLHSKEKIQNDVYKGIMVEARNLKHQDLSWGGIVGGKIAYRVTDKADGQRCLLIVNQVGLWTVLPAFQYNLIDRIHWKNLDKDYSHLIGLICDGEDIPISNRLAGAPSSSVWIQLFDILAIRNSIKIQEATHDNRLQELAVLNDLNSIVDKQLFSYKVKSFRAIRSVSDFFIANQEILNLQRNYLTDGLIYTPNNEVYNAHRGSIKYEQRILSEYSDVCKWKPTITLDLKIGDDRKLYTVEYQNKQANYVEFQGSKIIPFISSNYDKQLDDGTNLDQQLAGTIVEFKWQGNSLKPLRIRDDKVNPNPLHISLDNWKYIHDPILQETIIGQTTSLMSKYHNLIKRRLFNSLPENSSLLDIASGRGGDVSKWRKFKRVVAVEPSSANLAILRQRVIREGMQEKVKILEAKGQDTAIISKTVKEFLGKADYCSIMLGFSFFWESEESLQALMQTILQNTNYGLIFLTVDGDVIKQLWEPSLSINRISSNHIIIGKDYFEYNPDLQPPITVNIGKIVNHQQEYLVFLGDVMRYLELEYIYRADQEPFLNDNEKVLSSMYSYGYFSIPKHNTNIVSLELEKPEVVESINVVPESPKSLIEEPLEIKRTIATLDGELLKPLAKEDFLQYVANTMDNKLVRIASMEKNSFLDAYLKAFHVDYQNSRDRRFRIQFIQQLKMEIAVELNKERQELKVWNYVANGLLYDYLINDIINGQTDASLRDIQLRLNTINEPLNYIDIVIITDILGIDIIVFQGYLAGLKYYYTTCKSNSDKKVCCLVICENDHVDLLGLKTSQGVKTLFEVEDSFISNILRDQQLEPTRQENANFYLANALVKNLYTDEIGNITLFNLGLLDKSEPLLLHISKMFKIVNEKVVITKAFLSHYV